MTGARGSRSAWRRAAGVAVAGAAILLVASPARSGSDAVRGQLTSEAVRGPACSTPVGLCTKGTLKGSLKGEFTLTFTSVTATVDSPTTAVVLYTGDMEVATRDGTFTCKDAGALANTGDRSVASICTIVAGTGEFLGASGRVRLTGTSPDLDGGEPAPGFAKYEGTITP